MSLEAQPNRTITVDITNKSVKATLQALSLIGMKQQTADFKWRLNLIRGELLREGTTDTLIYKIF